VIRRQSNDEVHESNQSLLLLAASPAIWTVHFLLSYFTAAIWCAKFAGPDGSLRIVQVAIAVYTLFALVGIGIIGWSGYRRHSYGNEAVPHDFDSPEDRHRFLGFATLLLSGLSAVATIYVALVVVFVRSCD
jgi:hypothetical protein